MKAKKESDIIILGESSIIQGASRIRTLNDQHKRYIEQDFVFGEAFKEFKYRSLPWVDSASGGVREFRWYWAFTMQLSKMMKAERLSSIAYWGKRMMGDRIMIVEDRGSGTIHHNEPNQAVILSMAAVDHVMQTQNPLRGAKRPFPGHGTPKSGRAFQRAKLLISEKMRVIRDAAKVLNDLKSTFALSAQLFKAMDLAKKSDTEIISSISTAAGIDTESKTFGDIDDLYFTLGKLVAFWNSNTELSDIFLRGKDAQYVGGFIDNVVDLVFIEFDDITLERVNIFNSLNDLEGLSGVMLGFMNMTIRDCVIDLNALQDLALTEPTKRLVFDRCRFKLKAIPSIAAGTTQPNESQLREISKIFVGEVNGTKYRDGIRPAFFKDCTFDVT